MIHRKEPGPDTAIGESGEASIRHAIRQRPGSLKAGLGLPVGRRLADNGSSSYLKPGVRNTR